MIFGKRSKRGLKYARTRAKIDEFMIDPGEMPGFAFDSDSLCFESVLAISDALDLLSEKGELDDESRRDLSYTASFLNAAANENRHAQKADSYWTLACAAYFLLGNYGSSKFALNRVGSKDVLGHNARLFLSIIDYLFNCAKDESFPLPLFVSYMEGRLEDKREVAEEVSRNLTEDNAADSFFADVVSTCTALSMEYAAATLLPRYSGIPLSSWEPTLKSNKFGKLLWQAQQRVGEKGAFAGDDLFIQLPTGSGKTKSIELIIRSRILAGDCDTSIVVAPLRALCSEISKDLEDSLGDVACVHHASDIFELDGWLNLDDSKPEVLVFTPEKLSFVLHHSELRATDIDLFVFDESHLIDNASRGPSYELLLAEIIAAKENAQLVLISAVTSNPERLSEWAFSDPTRCTTGDGIESTEKTIGFLSRNTGSIDFFQYGGSTDLDYFLPYHISALTLPSPSHDGTTTQFPDLKASAKRRRSGDLALFYSIQLAHGGPAAIFIPKRSNVWAFHERIAELASFGLDFSRITSLSDPEELGRIARLFALHYGEHCAFSKSASSGILPHFGTLQGALKQAIEHAMRTGAVRCVSCTSTLAQGVNLPIRYLLVTDRSNGFENATVRDFQNLIGRTARAGKYSEGSIVVCDVDLENQRARRDYRRLFEASAVEKCESAILSLFEDVTLWDGKAERRVRGSDIANFILEYFDDGDLESKLVDALASAFKCAPEKISRNVSEKITSLEAVENYVANMVDAKDEQMSDTKTICSNTYAYFCMDDDKQELLIKLFEAIYDHFEEQNSEQRIAMVAKTQAGIRKSTALRNWIVTEECSSFLKGGCSNLSLLIDAFFDIEHPNHQKWLTAQGLAAIARMWIEGANIESILAQVENDCAASKRSRPSLESISKVTAETVSYDLSHFVSQVSDAASIVLGTKEHEKNLLALQKRLKYGVSGMVEAQLCEELFDDRLVVKEIAAVLGPSATNRSATLKLNALIKRAQVEHVLEPYPSLLMNRFRTWLA